MAVIFKLAEVRKSKGFSQNGLAQSIGMSLQNVQHLERKAKAVPFDTLDKLCRSLNCNAGDLIEYVPDDEAAA